LYYNNRGTAFMRKNEFDQAMKDFNTAIKLDSQCWSAYHNKGMAFSSQGRHDRAVEEFSKVIEANPNSPVLYKERGLAYTRLGDYDAALKDLQTSLDQSEDYAPAYAALGLLLATAEDPAYRDERKALTFAERAVELTDGKSPDMYRFKADVLMALNQQGAAVQAIQKAIQLDPNNQDYRELLSRIGGSPVATNRPDGKSRSGLW
jgi:tetratricopeptide (TPR) repeat protein